MRQIQKYIYVVFTTLTIKMSTHRSDKNLLISVNRIKLVSR